MPFPEKNWLGIKKDWEDLGEVQRKYASSNEYGHIYDYEVHGYCHTNLHIGKEKGEIFKFCPLCLIKLI